MRPESDSNLMKIGRHEIVKWPDGSGDTLRCMTGSLWITEHGSSEDFLLGPGQSLPLAGKRGVVLQGLRRSSVWVIRRAPHVLSVCSLWYAIMIWLRECATMLPLRRVERQLALSVEGSGSSKAAQAHVTHAAWPQPDHTPAIRSVEAE